LGIETMGRVTTVLIPRNTTVPVRKSEIFSTAENNQTAVDIHVLQGERQMAPDNRSLGKFQLTGLPPAPRGVPQVEVSFNIDANGILSVSAKDKATGKEQQITITSASGLNSDEIDRMVREAKDNEDDDRLKKEMVEVRNKLDSLVYQTEKSLAKMNDKISAGDKSAVEGALSAAKAALETEDKSSIADATTVLESALHGMAKTMYESATSPDDHPDTASYNTDDADSDIIDAEFVSA
jgi:molecular chaperone DnaK